MCFIIDVFYLKTYYRTDPASLGHFLFKWLFSSPVGSIVPQAVASLLLSFDLTIPASVIA